MTPQDFIARWKNNELTERAGAQAHFDDLCDPEAALKQLTEQRQPTAGQTTHPIRSTKKFCDGCWR